MATQPTVDMRDLLWEIYRLQVIARQANDVVTLARMWGTASVEPDAATRDRWHRYVAGYRSVRAIGDADFAAIALFVIVRHFWLMGEYAGRIDAWGTQATPRSWRQKQVELLTAWESLQTPD